MIEPIDNALRQLRESTSRERASDALEGKLLIAFRAQQQQQVAPRHRWAWITAAIAASVLLLLGWRFTKATAVQAPAPAATQAKTLKPVAPAGRHEPPLEVANVKAVPKRRRHKAAQLALRRAESPKPQEQDFIEIPYAPALEAFDGG